MTQKTHYSDILENPMGTEGFEFLEFTTTEPEKQMEQFKQLGFQQVGKHPSAKVWLFEQNQIRFILHAEPNSHAHEFSKKHGPSVSAMGFKVKDAEAALAHAKKLNERVHHSTLRTFSLPTLEGVGGSLIYLVDKAGREAINHYFNYKPAQSHPVGLTYIDHVTHNLNRGNMNTWADYYSRIFNFREIRYFNITGKMTGLTSRAMTSPCGKIRIPLNESSDDKSQIEEFLHAYNGEGIQHIALGAGDIYHSVETLRKQGIDFLNTPGTYFDMIEARLPQHGETLERLRKNQILIDGNTRDAEKKLLLQIFTMNMLGPVFFEIIQRKGDEGFGEGNFQALFEAIERDQIERGVL